MSSILKEVAVEGAIEALDLDEVIRPYSRRAVYHEGEYVYLPGDPSDTLYLIIEGRVKLSYPGRNGRDLTLTVLGEGELFGEMALVGGERRELAAEVMERTSIWVIDKQDFLRLLRERERLPLQVMELFLLRLKRLEERMMELILHDPLVKLSLLFTQTLQEDGGESLDLRELIRVAMADGAIATPPL
ncbi:MAG TPA: Crp/Fnr family transcriptional regulator [Candidatus Latescibacteria bacterium]|nr:Crp/Fnr family transcriptional regulator [Candidatus Latescibacterota bacterium]